MRHAVLDGLTKQRIRRLLRCEIDQRIARLPTLIGAGRRDSGRERLKRIKFLSLGPSTWRP
jgi:hypothetical protein